MIEQQTPEEIERAAADAVRRADETLADLEQRVLDDDQDVTPTEIETARSARQFAGLRQKAAQKKAAALREQQQAAERDQAFAAAREILAEHPDAEVDAALHAAGEAMMRLRAAVRARNDAQDRARVVLEACPALEPHTPAAVRLRGVPAPAAPELGYGWRNGRPILWAGGQAVPRLDEEQVLDRARKHPHQVDQQEATREQEAARERGIERDAALYGEDRAAFDALPAARRKPALDRLGVDWDSHMRQREQALARMVQGV